MIKLSCVISRPAEKLNTNNKIQSKSYQRERKLKFSKHICASVVYNIEGTLASTVSIESIRAYSKGLGRAPGPYFQIQAWHYHSY